MASKEVTLQGHCLRTHIAGVGGYRVLQSIRIQYNLSIIDVWKTTTALNICGGRNVHNGLCIASSISVLVECQL